MKTAVRYYSRTGNTKVIAEAIAAAAGCRAETVEVPLEEKTDLLFLGGAIYWGKIPGVLKDYMRNLSPMQAERVAVFTTAGILEGTSEIYKAFLKHHDLKVMKESYFCSGKRAFEEKTKEEAEIFVEKVMNQMDLMLKTII